MTEFIFTTLQDRTTSFTGPSGLPYTINKGLPFMVTNELDIDFFKNNKRFKEVNIINKIIGFTNVEKTDEDKLRDYLSGIDITKETINQVVFLYSNIEHLKDVVFGGYHLDPSIDETQKELIKNHILGVSPEPIEHPIEKKKKSKKR